MDLEKHLATLKARLASDAQVVQVKIITNAPKIEFTEVLGELENPILKLKIKAIPEKGKANDAIVKFCQKFFGARVEILSGHRQSLKRLKIVRR